MKYPIYTNADARDDKYWRFDWPQIQAERRREAREAKREAKRRADGWMTNEEAGRLAAATDDRIGVLTRVYRGWATPIFYAAIDGRIVESRKIADIVRALRES